MNNQPFFIDTFLSLLDKYNRKEISSSKLVEDLNTVAHSWATDSEKKATWTVRDIDLITDYADFDEKAKIKMIEDRIQKFWQEKPTPVTGEAGQIMKYAEYIRRNADKINQHTWKVYKEQILMHVENIEAIAASRTSDARELEELYSEFVNNYQGVLPMPAGAFYRFLSDRLYQLFKQQNTKP